MHTDNMTALDRAAVIRWMQQRTGETVQPEEILPENGISVRAGEKLLAVVTLYCDVSAPVAVAAWVFTAPDNTPRISHRAVSMALEALPAYAKALGKNYLLSINGNRVINSILDDTGFVTAENGFLKIKKVGE